MLKVTHITLDNGLKVVVSPTENPSVVCCLRGFGGSNYEHKNEIGTAHTLEHLITYGTANFPNKYEYRNLVTEKGGKITGTTDREDVAFLTKTLLSDYKKGLLFLSEIFKDPLFNVNDLKIVKENIKHEILLNREIPSNHLLRCSYKILYPKQRFEILNTGFIKHVNQQSVKKIYTFYKRLYHPQNFALAICGNVQIDEIVEYLSELLPNEITGKPAITKFHRKTRAFAQQTLIRDLKQLHIKIDYYGYKSSQKEKYAAYFIAKVLETRLKKELSYKQQIPTYVLQTSSFSTNTYGVFSTYIAIKIADYAKFVKYYCMIIDKLSNKEIYMEEFIKLKHKIYANIIFELEKTSRRASFLSELYLHEQVTRDLNKEVSNYRNISLDKIGKVLKELFTQKPKVSILGNGLTAIENERIWKTYLHLDI